MEIRRTFTFCDNCNLSHFIQAKGIFAGTRKEALKHGWKEADYGDACPSCAEKDAEAEVEEGGAGLEGVFNVITGKTGKPNE